MNKSTIYFMCLLSFIIPACNEPSQEEGGIIQVEDDDKEMNAAMQKAKDTADQFIAAFQNPTDRQKGFSVKKYIQDNEGDEYGEHIWIDPIRYKDGVIKGKIGNVPGKLENFKLGDPIDVKPSELSDWMFIDKGRLVGGYTIRVLHDKMGKDEQIQFKQSMPFKF